MAMETKRLGKTDIKVGRLGIGLSEVGFNLEMAEVTAADFAKLLSESLNMKGLRLGPDSALGTGRQGDPGR